MRGKQIEEDFSLEANMQRIFLSILTGIGIGVGFFIVDKLVRRKKA